jgi:hypothetical protein
MIQGKRLFLFEFKIGPYDILRFLFYSKNPRSTQLDFKNTLKETLFTLQKKYNKRNIYDLIRVPNFERELKLIMNRKGYQPIDDYNYFDLDNVLAE